MRFKAHHHGIALLTTLSVGVVLTILAVSLLALFLNDFSGQRGQQNGIQAYWNARSGVERYLIDRRIPKSLHYDLGSAGYCKVEESGQDLVFVGCSGRAERRIRLLGKQPGARVEE